MSKRFYKGHRIGAESCQLHRVFHGYVDGNILTATGDLNGKLTTGTIGFASIQAALEVAKQVIDDGLNMTSGHCLVELSNLRSLEPS